MAIEVLPTDDRRLYEQTYLDWEREPDLDRKEELALRLRTICRAIYDGMTGEDRDVEGPGGKPVSAPQVRPEYIHEQKHWYTRWMHWNERCAEGVRLVRGEKRSA